jgi:two-component system, OmpR family, sensor histidine kinase AdeS
MFALASIACVLLTVIFGYFGLSYYSDYQALQFENNLSGSARRAKTLIDNFVVPNEADAKALLFAYRDLEAQAEADKNIVLAVLSTFAGIVGACLGLALASYLARPIEEVADAARKIAKGDFSVRALAASGDAGESAQLISDFNKMAEALEGFQREMNESSAAIAHELRTPLTVLKGYVQGFMDGVFPISHDHIALLLVHIESLSRIVDDLQALTLADSGELNMSMRTIDVGQEIATLLDAMVPAIKIAGMTLERALEPAIIIADPARLRQAVAALIENARKYASEGGVIIVQTQAFRAGIVVRVLDRGAGLPEQHLVRSFDRFWRGEPSRARHSGGSGLGLSVVKAIAAAHGGQARITNRPGGGLSVKITLPKRQ